MKRRVLPDQMLQHVLAHMRRRGLRDFRQDHLLADAGNPAGGEDDQEGKADPEQSIGVAGHKDQIEHRLHHVAERTNRAAFEQHEDDGDTQKAHVVAQISAPQPDNQLTRGGVLFLHAGRFRLWRMQGVYEPDSISGIDLP